MYTFVASSQRIGDKKVSLNGVDIIIKTTGSWVLEEWADELCEMKFDVYCPALKKTRPIIGIFRTNPTIDQLKQKPIEGD